MTNNTAVDLAIKKLQSSNGMDMQNNLYIMPIIEISEPLFFTINFLGYTFAIYVLQNRTMLFSDNTKATVKELYISEVTIKQLINLFQKKISVYNFLDSPHEKYRLGQIEDKVFPPKKINNLSEIQDKIPDEKYTLNTNFIEDLALKEEIIKTLKERENKFTKSHSHIFHEEEQTFDKQFNNTPNLCFTKKSTNEIFEFTF